MSGNPQALKIKDFTYHLPDDRIARFPLSNRSDYKLLHYQACQITDEKFTSLPDLLPANSLLVFNNTKVVQARIFFQRQTGSIIEIFCLEPVAPSPEMQLAMQQTGNCTWKCLVGNAKRWKEDYLTLKFQLDTGTEGLLKAELTERLVDSFLIKFSWEPTHVPFAEILAQVGNLPLPPYLNREITETDKQTYQTVYAQHDGAVAAPTAGLHFTAEIMAALAKQNIQSAQVTLHVGAGTFKPVKAAEMAGHTMHAEEIYVPVAVITQLKNHFPNPVIPVGTTSLRTLESIFWLGQLIFLNPDINPNALHIPQWLPYEVENPISPAEAFAVLLKYAANNGLENIRATTQILITPGYIFKIISGLITNFHQPESTLLLLVSALIGEDWKTVYQHALANNYRFLSYGDSSLLIP